MCPPRIRSGLLPLVASAATALLVLAPALGGGFLLRYDMVFVPREPLGWGLLGLDAQTPRAVPSDLVVALASHVLPGAVVVPALLVLLLFLAGVGAGRVLPMGPWGSAAAGVAYIWTAYVGERLLIGQWAVLIGYAALPWVLRAAIRLAEKGQGWPSLIGWLALGCLGGGAAWVVVVPTALVALLLAGSVAGHAPRRVMAQLGGGLASAAVLALPWAMPALLRPGGVPADPAAASVFAPSPDTRLGALGSLLTGGGIWSSDVLPAGRDSVVGSIGALCVLGLSGVGWWLFAGARSERGEDLPARTAVLGVGALGLLLGAVGLVDPVATAIGRLPGGGLLRDSSRAVAPWCLVTAVGIGLAVPALAAKSRLPAVYALGLLPVAVLPSLAWGLGGSLDPVHYPRDYPAVEHLIDGDPRPGAVLVLPFEAYRRLPWNHDQTSLSAVPRWLDRVVVRSSDLPVRLQDRTVVVAGEDRLAARVATALADPDPVPALARLGIRWVVTDVSDADNSTGSGPTGAGALDGLRPLYAGPALTAREVPDVDPVAARDPARADRPPRPVVLGGDLIWAGFVLGALLAGALRRRFTAATVR
jgi:hypothetical protein